MIAKISVVILAAIVLPSLLISGCTTGGISPDTQPPPLPNPPAEGGITTFEECVAAGNPVMESYPRQCRTQSGETFVEDVEQPIGGERGEHGCLGPAGYSWDEDVGACIRSWEFPDPDQKRAAGIAVDHLGWRYATTVISVEGLECIGCFTLTIEQGEERERTKVEVRSWELTSKTVLYHQCTDEEKAAEICTMEYVPVCGYMENGTSETYGNACSACSAGVDYWEAGECG
jgi:hypothetical protein